MQMPMWACAFRSFAKLHNSRLESEPITWDWPQDTLWVLGFLAILGVLLTWLAYRRWLVADID